MKDVGVLMQKTVTIQFFKIVFFKMVFTNNGKYDIIISTVEAVM